MDNVSFVLLLVFFILLCVAISFIVRSASTKRKHLVEETSELISGIIKLNKEYNFRNVEHKLQYDEYVSSKAKYDKFNIEDYFNKIVITNYGGIIEKAENILYNSQLYDKYKNEVANLKSNATVESTKQLKISYKSYTKIENELFNELKLKPTTKCFVTCTVNYTSPAGRNEYSRWEQFDISTVPQRYEQLKKQLEYQNSEVVKRKRERSLMTPSLRYDIMRRDGFKCVLCGRTADDGVKLHIDHIIPVSKGGKTVRENLRTLCEDCNLGKSDKIE